MTTSIDTAASLLVKDSAVTAVLNGLTVVALVRRHEIDHAVAVPVDVPVDKRRHPLAGFLHAGE